MMDEAYSYGYSNIRDAATITPRSEVQPLVLPDDIMRLPSLRGFLVFPEGFDAARIKLTYKDWPKVAEGYVLRENVQPIEFVPPVDDAEETEVGGREPRGEPERELRGDEPETGPGTPASEQADPEHPAPENPPQVPGQDPSVGKQMAFRLEQAPQGARNGGREQEPPDKTADHASAKAAAQRAGVTRELNDPVQDEKPTERGAKAAREIDDRSHSHDDGPEM